MSRKEMRFMKQIGVNKKINELFDSTVKSIMNNVENFDNYRFEYDDIEYDLEPIMILLPLLLGALKNGDRLLKKELYDKHIKNYYSNNELYKSNPISNMANLIIFEGYSKCGLDVSLLRSIAIAKKMNLYKGDLGGYNFEILKKSSNEKCFYEENEEGELTLSQIFNSALNNFSFRLFKNNLVREDFIFLYLLISGKEFVLEEDNFLKFIKLLMDYFIYTKKKENFVMPLDISGDLEEDINNIDNDYLEILNYLNNENILALALLEVIDFTD